MNITIAQIKAIREQIGATHIVVFAMDEKGMQHVATHGRNRQHAREAAIAGTTLKSSLGWPLESCNVPIERVCGNCAFFKPDWGMHCFNGWTGDGTKGHCHFEPERTATNHESTCSHFEPK